MKKQTPKSDTTTLNRRHTAWHTKAKACFNINQKLKSFQFLGDIGVYPQNESPQPTFGSDLFRKRWFKTIFWLDGSAGL